MIYFISGANLIIMNEATRSCRPLSEAPRVKGDRVKKSVR